VPEGEREYTKYKLSQAFDHPPFTGVSPVIEIGHSGKPVENRRGKSSGQNKFMRKAK
jgi:hypothetical protein